MFRWVMDVSTVAGVHATEGHSRFAALLLCLGCRFATDRESLASTAALQPCSPGEQTGQRSPLNANASNCHCPKSMVDRYPRSSGSSVMLWATSGSPGTHGIEQGRNHLSARDAR